MKKPVSAWPTNALSPIPYARACDQVFPRKTNAGCCASPRLYFARKPGIFPWKRPYLMAPGWDCSHQL